MNGFFKAFFAAVFVITLLPSLSFAQPTPEQAAIIQKQAAAGDANGEFMYGVMLMTGEQVQKDPVKGLEYMTRSAEKGHERAQFMLGLSYGTDMMGIQPDKEKARYWLTKAAQQGNKKAEAMLLSLDAGKSSEGSESIETLLKKAEAGDVSSQYILGGRYMNGWGVEKNIETGMKWLRAAAEKGDPLAQSDLGLYLVRNGNTAEGLPMMTAAAERGVVHSQFELGTIYEGGKIVSADPDKAALWYKKAAAQGDKRAITALQRLGLQ